MRTGYLDYRHYLDEHHHGVLSEFEDFSYLSMYGNKINDLWSDLEEALTLDYMECIDSVVRDNYPDLNNDSDDRWYEIESELETQIRFIYKFTGEYLYEWLSSIDFSNCTHDLPLNSDDLYVTFNYTTTLEKIYNIPRSHILHIHGCIDKVDSSVFWVIIFITRLNLCTRLKLQRPYLYIHIITKMFILKYNLALLITTHN